MLSNSITYRALEIINNNPEIEILEAVKLAIQEENKMIQEVLENRTDRSKNIRTEMRKCVYASFHVKECFNQ